MAGKEIKPLTICLIGGGGFIGSHLCEKLMTETLHKAVVIDVSSDKIDHLLGESCSWLDRIELHKINVKNESCPELESLIKSSDLTINLEPISVPVDMTCSDQFLDTIPVVKHCAKNKKRLIHFSSCQVYQRTIESCLPFRESEKSRDNLMQSILDHLHLKDPKSYTVREYTCTEKMSDMFTQAAYNEPLLEFTFVRAFNWIGPRMDFIPSLDTLRKGVPRVLASFCSNLLHHEPLKLVDGEQSKISFCSIKDAIDAVLLIIENPEQANGQVLNVGNPNNEVTFKELAELLIEVYAKVSGVDASDLTTIGASSDDYDRMGYESYEFDRNIPDMTTIHKQLGWSPRTSLYKLLEDTLTYLHGTCSQSIKK